MLRIAFYYNHFNTVGHSLRVFSLVKNIKKKLKEKVKIIILQDGKKQNLFPFNKYGRLYFLPYGLSKKAFFSKTDLFTYQAIKDGALKYMFKERAKSIREVLHKFRPHIFITEYYPLGMGFWSFETPYILDFLKERFHCKIIGSTGYPTWSKDSYKIIKQFYDMVFIHCPRDFFEEFITHPMVPGEGRQIIKNIENYLGNRLIFTGYILDKNFKLKRDIRESLLLDKKYLVLVSRGGGIINERIILNILLLAKELKRIFIVISTGIFTEQKKFNHYRKLSESLSNVKLVKMLEPNFESYLKACNLSINMAGYNTVVRILWFGKKSIIFPQDTTEQLIRADLISKNYPVKVLSQNTDLEILEKSILEMVNKKDNFPKLEEKKFQGLENTIDYLFKI